MTPAEALINACHPVRHPSGRLGDGEAKRIAGLLGMARPGEVSERLREGAKTEGTMSRLRAALEASTGEPVSLTLDRNGWRVAVGDGSAPVSGNCWTCKHNTEIDECDVIEGRTGGDINNIRDVHDWISIHVTGATAMPPKDADGCPGYEVKP